MDKKIQIQQQIVDKYAEENIEFMNEFIRLYLKDPSSAKAMYYQRKVKIDVGTPLGQEQKRKMIKKYLEGLQWVLYYYYKGAQHWRWYYPYHYAPMISDLDQNIVQFYLDNKHTIDEFEVDHNCSELSHPYTPLQQLLCIMPIKSIHLLPVQYHPIFSGELKDFFPLDFEIDLNGRALPWEAAILIPFVDEKDMLKQEKIYLDQDPLCDDDFIRNQISFKYRSCRYDKGSKLRGTQDQLESTIKFFQSLPYNHVEVTLHSEYEDVGKHSFTASFLRGVIIPDPCFPSFTWAQIRFVEYDEKVINHVPFKRVLLKVPKCIEELTPENLETFVDSYVKSKNHQLFIGLPYQYEAFPTVFENESFIFTVFGDQYTG